MLFKHYASLNVKIIGPSIGDAGKPIIDGDLDGRCREQNGNWIPCPPGTGTGVTETLQQAASAIKAWDRPFEAGKWEKVDAYEHALAITIKAIGDANAGRPLDLDAVARSVLAGKGLEGKSVYINGPVMLSAGNLGTAAVQQIAKQVDDLYRLNPPKNRLTINFKDLPPGVDGLTIPALKADDVVHMELDSKLFMRAFERLPARPRVPKKTKPYNQNTISIEKRKWVLVHEWGHVIDTRPMEQNHTANTRIDVPLSDGLFALYKNSPDAGEYASVNQYEMYAESFADWVTSKGKSTNPVTLAYAKYFKWNAS
jgi:hypothetical protein